MVRQSVNWAEIALFVTIAGLGATLFEYQIVVLDHKIDLVLEGGVRNDDMIRNEMTRREMEIKEQLKHTHDTSVNRAEHDEFAKRVDAYMAVPYLPRPEFEAWLKERNLLITEMTKRIGAIEDSKVKK